MREELYSLGIKNVVYVPNSKPIIYRPNTNKFKLSHIIKFVFVSRIHPDKGCDDIFNAVQMLNDRGYSDRFEVSFWGPVFPSYKESFNTQLQEYKNVNYCGFLDFTCVNGYDILSNYDIMLFPSYWSGEGFPGVIIDAYIAGLPIIASDWNLNQEVIENEKTGFIIRTKDVQGLYNAMLNCIEGRVDILTMRRFCVKYAEKFDYRNVISIKLLNSIGIK